MLLVVHMAVFREEKPELKILIAIVILLVYGVITHMSDPYQSKLLNRYNLLTIFTLITLACFKLMMMSNGPYKGDDDKVYGIDSNLKVSDRAVQESRAKLN